VKLIHFKTIEVKKKEGKNENKEEEG